MDSKICIRCNSNNPVFTCLMCDSFKILCSKCDNYIHSLPSKRLHKRQPLDSDIKVSHSMNFISSQSPTRYNTINTLESNKLTIRDDDIINQSPKFDYNNYSKTYSREYVMEIMNIFEKEKNELIFKNNSLNTTLNNLKINLSAEINNLTDQLEDMNKKYSANLKKMQENSEERAKAIIQEKNNELDDLIKKIEEIEKDKFNLKKIVDEKNRHINQLQYELEIKNKERIEVGNLLMTKDDNINDLEKYYEDKINEINIYYENDKLKYEENLNLRVREIIDKYDNEKNEINYLREKKEKEMQSLINDKQTEIENLKDTVRELKEVVEYHKANIINLKDKIDRMENEISELNKSNEDLIYDNKYLSSENKLLDDHNKMIIEENQNLKVQMFNYDKLMYKKTKVPIYSKKM